MDIHVHSLSNQYLTSMLKLYWMHLIIFRNNCIIRILYVKLTFLVKYSIKFYKWQDSFKFW